MQEKLLEVFGDIEITSLDDTAEEDLLDEINGIILDDVDNPFDVFKMLNTRRGERGNHRYLYLDGWLTESAYERLEDLLCDYGLKIA